MTARREAAEGRMEKAKAMLTTAAKATLAGDPKASELAREALRAIENARTELRAQDEVEEGVQGTQERTGPSLEASPEEHGVTAPAGVADALLERFEGPSSIR